MMMIPAVKHIVLVAIVVQNVIVNVTVIVGAIVLKKR
jgi:hypothetical protein